MPEPYEASEVISICTRMQEQAGFQNLQKKLTQRHDLLHGLMAVDIPGVMQKLELRSPVLRSNRTQYTNRLVGANFRVSVAARSADSAAQESAQRTENISYALFEDLTAITGEDHDRGAVDQLVTYWAGVLRLDFTEDMAEALLGKSLDEAKGRLPEPGFTSNPFRIFNPGLTTVAFEPDQSAWSEVGAQKVSDLMPEDKDSDLAKYLTSRTVSEDTNVYTDEAKVYHLDTGKYIYDVIEGAGQEPEELSVRVNPAGRPLYVLMPGHENSESDVSERYEPLIGALYAAVDLLNIVGTLEMSGAFQTGRVTYQLVTEGGRAAESFIDFQQMVATERPVLHTFDVDQAVHEPPEGKRYLPMPVPDQHWLAGSVDRAERLIDRLGFPAALSTDMPLQAETESGVHAAKAMEAASDFLEPALRGRAKGWKAILQLCHDVLKELGVSLSMPVQLRAQGKGRSQIQVRKLEPTDLKEHDLHVEFKSVPASVQMAIEENLMRRHQGGFIDKQSILEQLYDDPSIVQERMDLEQLREPVKQRDLEAVLAVLAESDAQRTEQAAAEAGVPATLPPAESFPGGPEVPGGTVNARPPGGSFPGVGAPLNQPEPGIAGEQVPVQAGGGVTGVA